MPRVGFKFSEESKKKMSVSKIKAGIKPPSRSGLKPWNFNRNIESTICKKCNGIKASRKAEVCRKCKVFVPWNKGKKLFNLRGEKHYNWKGGLTKMYDRVRNSFEYRQWRCDVFTRDKYTCQVCGDNKGGNLNAHHIKPFALILRQYSIKDIEDAFNCVELWNINNGQTLCEKCHIGTPTFGGKFNSKFVKNENI